MIISFGWTTPALLADAKTVTRRDWNPKHAAKFKAGMLVDAWNTSPRNVKGNPHKVATIRLTAGLEVEWSDGIASGDYEAEGFAFLAANGYEATVERILHDWRSKPRMLYVVRFEVVEYTDAAAQRGPEGGAG